MEGRKEGKERERTNPRDQGKKAKYSSNMCASGDLVSFVIEDERPVYCYYMIFLLTLIALGWTQDKKKPGTDWVNLSTLVTLFLIHPHRTSFAQLTDNQHNTQPVILILRSCRLVHRRGLFFFFCHVDMRCAISKSNAG